MKGRPRVRDGNFGQMFVLGVLQKYGGGQQNSNQPKYQQCEQSHQKDRHSYTSLLSHSLASLLEPL
jgi:hypothetical protein